MALSDARIKRRLDVAMRITEATNLCWPQLHSWATEGDRMLFEISRDCQKEADELGQCWCNKFRNEEVAERRWAEYAKKYGLKGVES